MENRNVEKKIQELKEVLLNCKWQFKKYMDSERDNFLEEDYIIETLDTVREFYLTESIILSDNASDNGVNFRSIDEFRKELGRISELHDLFIKLEYIYVYKVNEFLKSDKFIELSEIFGLYKWIENFLFFHWDKSDEYQYIDYNHHYRWRRYLRKKYLRKKYLDDETFYEWIIEELIFVTRELQTLFSHYINEIQDILLKSNGTLNFVVIKNTKVFHPKFPENIKKHLQNLDENLYKKAFEKPEISCYATIEFNGKKYITVNGVDLKRGKDKILKEFKGVLESRFNSKDIEIVNISDDVRYYFNGQQEYINYVSFLDYDADNKYNRMFTCCERKLFAKIREVEGTELDNIKSPETIKLATTKYPCEMCEREIKLCKKISVSCLEVKLIEKYDKIAKEILKAKS